MAVRPLASATRCRYRDRCGIHPPPGPDDETQQRMRRDKAGAVVCPREPGQPPLLRPLPSKAVEIQMVSAGCAHRTSTTLLTGLTTLEHPVGALAVLDHARGRVEAMRHVLSLFPYEGKDEELVGRPDERIVGSAASVIEHGERSDRVFPEL